MSKTITKLCATCKYFKIIDKEKQICNWGFNKKRKILKVDRVRNICNLIEESVKK